MASGSSGRSEPPSVPWPRHRRWVLLAVLAAAIVAGVWHWNGAYEQLASGRSECRAASLGAPVRTYGSSEPLYQIVDAAIADQTVYVLTASMPAVHVFSLSSDSAVANWGAEGGGPGEMANPTAIAIGDAMVHVLELAPGDGAVSVFEKDGEFVRTVPLRDFGLTPDFEIAESSYIIEASTFASTTSHLVAVNSGRADTILTLEGPAEVRIPVPDGPMRTINVSPPFAPAPEWTITSSGSVAWWPGSGREIEVVSTNGDSLPASIVLPDSVYRLTPSDRENWLLSRFPPDAERFGIRDFYAGARRAAESTFSFPETFPTVIALRPNPAGGVWVLQAERTSGDLWVLADEQGVQQKIVAPPGRSLVDFSNEHVLATTTDDLGVERVEIYRRPRPSACNAVRENT